MGCGPRPAILPVMDVPKVVNRQNFRIEGGMPLHGAVRVSGAKNAALPAMAAALLTGDDCVLENVPEIDEVPFMAAILRSLGATVRDEGGCRRLVGGVVL